MTFFNNDTVFTVSQFTAALKSILEGHFRFVRISGEISNVKTPFSGHSYFTLKDSGAQIRAVLFKQQKRFVDLDLQDGQHVVVFGRISVYEPRGEYQIVADSVELYGIGKLLQEFEKLKRKLADKGYFAAEIKKSLPSYPRKIVVISSPTGAAIHDFLKIVSIRKSPVHILILPVRVQGSSAAAEIAGALEKAQDIPGVDVIVLCRGGGSMEDLWAFNEEIVAQAIHRSKRPVVTGIGHEIDYTIADFCADFRCPTPTGAAEKLIPDADMLRNRIQNLHTGLRLSMDRRLRFLEHQLAQNRKMLGDMRNVFSSSEFRLQFSKKQLVQAMIDLLQEKELRILHAYRHLQKENPSTTITLQEHHLKMLASQLQNHMQRILEKKQALLSEQATLLHGVSPLATLARGYAIVRKNQVKNQSWQVVTRARDTQAGEELNILLREGQLDCVVTSIREEPEQRA